MELQTTDLDALIYRDYFKHNGMKVTEEIYLKISVT